MSDDISISVYLTALKRLNAQNADLLARIAELEVKLTSERDRADRIAREVDQLRWEREGSAKYSSQLRRALEETLAVAERNELGDYKLRARAALSVRIPELIEAQAKDARIAGLDAACERLTRGE